MPEHLLLPERITVDSRRSGGGGGQAPRRNPRRHGQTLADGLASVRAARRLDVRIDPDLVFKIRTVSRRLDDGTLLMRGLVPLGETIEYTYFVLADDEGRTFEEALRGYSSAEDVEGAPAELSSLFGLIDAVEPYGPEDRRGPGLNDLPATGPYVVDVAIWAAGDFNEAQARSEIVAAVVETAGGTVLLRDVRPRRPILRGSVDAAGLDDLLNTSVVERVRTPPVPYLDPSDWRTLQADDLGMKREGGAPVGILDDLPAVSHPLLARLIASTTEIAPAGYQWQAPGHHGTQVAGRVLFPNLHAELRDHLPLTAVGQVHVARVLEPDPNLSTRTRFPAGAFPHVVVEQAIRTMHKDHGVRVFNLSFGYDQPADLLHVDELTETIDDLVRELDIVVVVPTGNAPATMSGQTVSGHHVERDYPRYFDDPLYGLAAPAPAALALTVGAIAHSDAPEERTPPRIGWRAIAQVGHLSPFSRTGPGIGPGESRRNKPDFVHEGGNWVLSDIDQLVPEDAGVSVISLAMEPSGRMFRACVGTSFATPLVARTAADVLTAYPEASANMIRALLAASARRPEGASSIADEARQAALYGLGRPEPRRAVESWNQRVTMTYDGLMAVDTVAIHPLPVPESFAAGVSNTRRIQVALAFNPPVRRQRREYLAGTMQVDLYRAVDSEALVSILERQDRGDPELPINDRRKVSLVPGVNSYKSSTLMLRSWEPRRLNVDDGDTYFLAVTHRTQTWARDREDYRDQRYALAAVLEDEGRIGIDLHELVRQQVRVPARLRVRT